MVGTDSFFNTVAAFEVYNQHLLMDIGAFQIGLGAALLLAGISDPADALAVGLIACRHRLGRPQRLSHRRARPRGNAGSGIPLFGVLSVLLLAGGLMRWPRRRAQPPRWPLPGSPGPADTKSSTFVSLAPLHRFFPRKGSVVR
jgi:hypothetical protein